MLCSQRWRSSIQSTKTRPGADCGSDHELLIAKFRLKLKKVGKTTKPFRYDLNQIPYDYTVQVTNKYHTIALISHVSKVMLKILQTRLQQYMSQELPDVQAGFRKWRRTKDQIANICWIIDKAREFQKNIYFCFIDYAKTFDCVDHNKLWKILQEMGIPNHLICLLRNLYAGQEATVRTEQQTGSQLGKEYIKAVYCHPAYLTSMQSTSRKMLSWKKHKLESRLPGEISITSNMQMTPLVWQKAKKN